MSKVETILSQLKDIAANPKKAMDDFKAETGKGAVGVMPIYAPEEMIHATGFLPMGLWGAQGKTVSKARTYLPAFACSIMQQIMPPAQEANGKVPATGPAVRRRIR